MILGTGADLLTACAREAERHAARLAQLDDRIGAELANGLSGLDPVLLQSIDLFRQEAEGLARALKIADTALTQGTVLDDQNLTASVPLADQRERLMPAKSRS